ncbi:response regulator transcription factor [Paenibacillus spiritus]|uniref:Response regulator transcription factor n=1 Tax=Paenibacillus spiritus TaxID=2496557 RepID=A0A5J5G1B5_9BACL|nr:response regulator transcription factor [Paenibacillus spiritus]KAA8999647.1 response regulator transcription factor [Paenibacillus spiritus]
MNNVWRVVIMGNYPTGMLGTKLILEEDGDLEVAGMLPCGFASAAAVQELSPDVVLVDGELNREELGALLPGLKKACPTTYYILIADLEEGEGFYPLIEQGASGILPREASPQQLLQMIRGLRQGFLSMPLDWLSRGPWNPAAHKRNEKLMKLNPTEIFIMERIVQGITYDKIAVELDVSRRSIDNYLRKIYVKLDVSTRAQAIEQFALYSRGGAPVYA